MPMASDTEGEGDADGEGDAEGEGDTEGEGEGDTEGWSVRFVQRALYCTHGLIRTARNPSVRSGHLTAGSLPASRTGGVDPLCVAGGWARPLPERARGVSNGGWVQCEARDVSALRGTRAGISVGAFAPIASLPNDPDV